MPARTVRILRVDARVFSISSESRRVLLDDKFFVLFSLLDQLIASIHDAMAKSNLENFVYKSAAKYMLDKEAQITQDYKERIAILVCEFFIFSGLL